MNKSQMRIVVVIVAVVLIGFITYYFMGMGKSTGTTDNSNPVVGATSGIQIIDMAFAPASITIKKNSTVIWTNKDSVSHTVTGDTTDGPQSKTLAPNDQYFFAFTKTGTYTYHCTFHPNMTGTVIVQ